MASYGSVPGKGRIRASVKKAFRRVPEKGRTYVSTEKWRNRGQYGEKLESVRVSKNFPGEYRKKVEIFEYRKMASYGSVPGKGRIRASVEKAFCRVPEKGRTCVSTEKW